jgi:hypothetical protein
VVLGKSRKAVVDFYGPGSNYRSHWRKPLRMASYRIRGGGRLTVAYAGNSVVGVETTSPYYSTTTGLAVHTQTPAFVTQLPWGRCQHAYRRSVRGVHIYYAVAPKKRTISRITMVNARSDRC